MGKVGEPKEPVPEGRLPLRRLPVQGGDAVAQGADLRLDLRRVPAGLLEAADLLAAGVPLGLEGLGLPEQFPVAPVLQEDRFHLRRVHPLAGQALGHLPGVFSDGLEAQHLSASAPGAPGR